MKIKVGVSQRHIHLTKEDYDLLFEEPLTIKNSLNQPGQYSSNQTASIKTNVRKIDNVRIIVPLREYTQVEISKTDAYYLKLNPPVRESGNLDSAEKITIIGTKGEITRKACIIPERHIHITPEERKTKKLNKENYDIKIKGEKGGIISNVKISESKEAYYEIHLDTDDANAFLIKQNDEVEIIPLE